MNIASYLIATQIDVQAALDSYNDGEAAMLRANLLHARDLITKALEHPDLRKCEKPESSTQ